MPSFTIAPKFCSLMLKYLVSAIMRRKRPGFNFDPAFSSAALSALVRAKAMDWLRGRKVDLSGTVFLGRGVRLMHRSNIRLGKWVQLDEYVYISALGRKPVRIGNQVHIGAFSRIVISTTPNHLGSHITIGDHVGIGEFAYLGGAGGLEIGRDCIIGQYFSCHPENHQYDNHMLPIRLQGVSRRGIRIGSNCWIGSKVTILDGVTVGDNCVIAAGAVVTKSMPPNSVIAGVPAKVVKSTLRSTEISFQ